MNNNKNGVFYGWWIVLGSIILLAVMGPASVAVANLYQPFVTEALGVSNSQFALSNSLVLGMTIFFSPLVSRLLANRFKLTFIIGVIIYTIGQFGYAISPNIWVFYFFAILNGLGNLMTTMLPVSFLMTNWFIKSRATATSLSMTGLGFGGVIFSYLITWLIENVGYKGAYMTYALIILVVGLIIGLFVFKVQPSDIGLKPYGADEKVDEDSDEMVKEEVKGISAPISEIATKPFFIFLLLGAVMIGLVNNGGLGQFPPYLTGLHGAAKSATVVAIYSGVGILGKLVLGVVTDKLGINVSLIYTGILCVLAYILMTFAGNYWMAIFAAISFGMGNAAGTVTPPLITSAIFDEDTYSAAFGYVNSAIYVGMTFGSLFASIIADVASYQLAWIILSVAGALFAIFWMTSYRLSKQYAK